MAQPFVKTYYRRHLPHYQPPEGTFHVVFRLEGSLPVESVARLRIGREQGEKMIASIEDEGHKRDHWRSHHDVYFRKFDGLLDGSSHGPRWLAEPLVAAVVIDAIRYRDGKAYDLVAYCIMPNHVHLVIAVGQNDIPSYKPLYRILQSLKRNSALWANRCLHRSGSFWQDESYDHLIRTPEELERTVWYVLNNPVKAGLVDSWEKWFWTYCKPGQL